MRQSSSKLAGAVVASLTVIAALGSTPAAAKPWQGIEAGVSKRADVVKKFGEPSRVVTNSGKETLAYFQKDAIRGTSQTQFKVDSATNVVERIDVFPGPVVDKDAVEATYGAQCGSPAAQKEPSNPCYVKKITDDFRTYFMYQALGMAIFFNEDSKTVHSLIFQPVKKPEATPAAATK